MRVLMIDDHVMFTQAIKTLLGVMAPHLVVDTADRLTVGIEMSRNATYGLVLLDWNLPECPGEEAFARMRAVGCASRIVVLSGETKGSEIRKVVNLGAVGFIPKRFTPESMIQALGEIIDGGTYFPPEAIREAGRATGARDDAQELVRIDKRFSELTPRQIDVYRAVVKGLPNKVIARQLGIAESTVKTHIAAVFSVLNVSNRTAAAAQMLGEDRGGA